MAVPKRKVTAMKRGHRRSGRRPENVGSVENPDTGELHRPHHIDLKTGYYRGRRVIDPPRAKPTS